MKYDNSGSSKKPSKAASNSNCHPPHRGPVTQKTSGSISGGGTAINSPKK